MTVGGVLRNAPMAAEAVDVGARTDSVCTIVAENFEVLASAEGGLTRLRTLILNLAVRGNLTMQESTDEPAEHLLVRLRVAFGPAPPMVASVAVDVSPRARPFEVPTGWRWARFTDVMSIASNLVPPAKFQTLPHIAPDNIEKGTGRLLPYRTIREDGVTSAKHRFFAGQILYSKIRPNLSKVVLVDFDGLCSADMYPLTARIDPRFLVVFLLSEAFLHQVVRNDNRLAMPKINQEQLSATLVAVPPLAEQSRIVAQVDRLMAMCDRLESQQKRQRDAGKLLTKATFETLSTSEGPEAFDATRKKVIENLDVLLARSEHIGEMRRALIDLAISGRLLPPRQVGSALSLVKELEAISEYPRELDAVPMTLPPSWEWTRLGAIASDVRYGYTASADKTRDGIRLLRITDIQNDRVDWSTVPGCEIDDERIPGFELHEGDLVIARTGGTIGKTYLVEGLTVRSVFASYLIRVSPLHPMNPRYLKAFTASGLYWRQLYAGAAGTGQPNVNATTLKQLLIPIPPVEEQRAIVAKVDQMMRICDDLEAKLRRAEDRAAKLVEAVVQKLLP
jgi:type I restriction enzyme S subunit